MESITINRRFASYELSAGHVRTVCGTEDFTGYNGEKYTRGPVDVIEDSAKIRTIFWKFPVRNEGNDRIYFLMPDKGSAKPDDPIFVYNAITGSSHVSHSCPPPFGLLKIIFSKNLLMLVLGVNIMLWINFLSNDLTSIQMIGHAIGASIIGLWFWHVMKEYQVDRALREKRREESLVIQEVKFLIRKDLSISKG